MNDQRIRERAYFRWLERADAERNWLEAELSEKKPPLVLFLGAGASLDVGVPGTTALTSAIVPALGAPRGCPNVAVGSAHLQALSASLQRTYGSPNFEHYQHGLETLTALNRSWRPSTAAAFRVVEAQLTGGLHSSFPSPVDDQWLTAAREEFFRSLYSAMEPAQRRLTSTPNWLTIADFLKTLAGNFTLFVVTTNYDTVVEQALNWGPSEQGFEKVSGEAAWRFSSRRPPRLMHLHGSLCFGFREGVFDPNRFAFEDQHEDLYCYDDWATAFATWFGRSGLTSMAGRDTHAGPIITGLQKPDKLIPEPYMSYYRYFQELCSQIPRVLVVGYGFGDQHLNAVLSRLGKWHSGAQRVAVIDYCSQSSWLPSSAWPKDRLPVYRTVAPLAAQADTLDVFAWPDPWRSSGPPAGCVEVYFRGWADSVTHHGARILKFLKS